MSTMTDFQMTNEEKADIFFKVAMEYLDLNYTDVYSFDVSSRQDNPVADRCGSSPYICDNLKDAVNYDSDALLALQDEMQKFGMSHFGFGAWKHIEVERRQEARWFFLMLMVEYLDDAHMKEILDNSLLTLESVIQSTLN